MLLRFSAPQAAVSALDKTPGPGVQYFQYRKAGEQQYDVLCHDPERKSACLPLGRVIIKDARAL